MKKFFLMILACAGVLSSIASPVVLSVDARQNWPWDPSVKVVYDLVGTAGHGAAISVTARNGGQPLLLPAEALSVAHVWFVMIHPFDDGNGRLARAISDMLISRSDGPGAKFYSVSSAILKDRKRYYSLLESLGHSDGDVTEWIEWFLGRVDAGLTVAEGALEATLRKTRFWDGHADEDFNGRQRKVINMLFDDFDGKLTSGKWAKVCKVSSDTALSDINDLVGRGVLVKSASGGRSTSYGLAPFPAVR